MDHPIIEIKNISKRYDITHKRESYTALRDIITEIIFHPIRFIRKKGKQIIGLEKKEEFWALKDINLNIEKGDIIGIIGKNGAGKSTLLKILSQITAPTTGEIKIHGTVGSLLEVGTGFHPELTGRENIYLNGSILGMTRKEIQKKFDQIVEFAGIEKFLDTPVKHYSSGMYVRLAFSVAAHMEPEILIIDEVLAVGDAEFQKKCMGKMKDVTNQEGRTILFVSHNMNAVEQLCTKCVILENGQIKKISNDVKATINEYIHGSETEESNKSGEWKNSGKEFDNEWFKPVRYYVSDKNGNIIHTTTEKNAELYLNIEADVKKIDPSLSIGYAIYSEEGTLLYWSYHTDEKEENWPKLREGKVTLRSKLPIEMLNLDTYRIDLIGGLTNRLWLFKPDTNNPSIHLKISGKISDSPYWITKRPGILAPLINWEKK